LIIIGFYDLHKKTSRKQKTSIVAPMEPISSKRSGEIKAIAGKMLKRTKNMSS
jgi:hypothetical protein